MDELDETEVPTAGERLRAAREEKGLSLEDVAAQTRIPRRHLESVEQADWENLPAPTYTIGFAKSYASAVGLDRTDIGEQLRTEMGGARAPTTAMEVFEPADPARSMPRWLVLAAIAAVALVIVVMTWLSNRSLHDDNQAEQPAAAAPAAQGPAQPTAPAAQAAAQGPVILAATQPVWVSVKDQGKVIKQGILQPGETYQVPTTAAAPILTTAKAEGLKVTVGTATAPQVGPAATKVTVSLLPANLMKGPDAAASATVPAPPSGASRPTARTHHTATPAAAAAPQPTVPAATAPAVDTTSPPAPTNTGE
ncbi:helix-turn-helix domain-containing protein [Sphingomonas sp.]|uniref:helix-turn-helix domain-containing protein n=1 Tax=Sphingomonas sp. TaxID=28214 RepID=UPI0025DD33C5|nr:helix-turn-helix domain-containing protein [Sphingomonas sp.]MBV9529103.1 helix-turn-helix domain-containing protein [Sphingomonas sp.]